LIVGLGNPGREHAGTRHNVGFMVAEALTERWQLGRGKERFRGRIAEGRVDARAVGGAGAAVGLGVGGHPILARPRVAVLCPQTYMNDAGRSVGPARGAFKLALERVLVVHDEIDLPFGEVRTRLGGGLAGHNGLKSIKRELGSADFMRVRVGVGRPDSTDPEIVSAHVLGRFREGDVQVRELVERACEQVERIVLGDEAAGTDPTPEQGAD
jgi:PTH1 family peptidyl-tRNA hydrolase